MPDILYYECLQGCHTAILSRIEWQLEVTSAMVLRSANVLKPAGKYQKHPIWYIPAVYKPIAAVS
jgi:hypothetical protein